jgi:hypothetical protein
VNGGVRGFEIGGLANINKGDVFGVQLAGIANINTKSANGIIASGCFNYNKDSSSQTSYSGLGNYSEGSIFGGQFTGGGNVVIGNLYGVQAASIFNYTSGKVLGAQFSSFYNHSGNLTGVQAAYVNKAKSVKGFQIGLINIADSYEKGLPIGFINVVKDGYHALELSATESMYLNANFKLGVNHLYTIFKAGYFSNVSQDYFSYGIGFGTKLGLTDHFKLSIDLSQSQILRQTYSPKINLLTKIDLSLRYELGKHLDFFAGPTLNVLTSESLLNSEELPISVPNAIYKSDWDNNNASSIIWIGGSAGLSLKF